MYTYLCGCRSEVKSLVRSFVFANPAALVTKCRYYCKGCGKFHPALSCEPTTKDGERFVYVNLGNCKWYDGNK